MPCKPETPNDAKQTNCWILVFVLEILSYISQIITAIQMDNWGGVAGDIIGIALFVIIMYHIAYTRVNVTDQAINVSMGPWEWPIFRWFCSSQVSKEEIFLIERKQRQCLYDIFPRLYCSPINWCCCHKSYSAYWWPCCCHTVNCCNCCDGDSDSSDMIVIHLTQSPTEFTPMCFKRCQPCPPIAVFWCCVYNRIAVAIKDESVWNTIQSCGYPLTLSAQNERTALAPGTTQGATEGQQPV